MISTAVVLLALRNRLLAVSGIPSAVAFANVDFTPTVGAPYLRESFVVATNVVETIGPRAIACVSGLYVVYWYGVEGTDLSPIATGVDAVLAKFAARTAITLSTGDVLQIRGRPGPVAGEAIPDGRGWCVSPITVPWEVRTTNVAAA